MANETTRAPTGLRNVFASTKAAIAETRDPAAVLKALIPMLREHAAEMKVKAKAKAMKSAPTKSTKTSTKLRKAAPSAPKPVVRRARKVAEAVA